MNVLEFILTKVKLSTTFSPQTDDQADHTTHIIEDILRAYIIDFKGNLNKHFPFMCFSLCSLTTTTTTQLYLLLLMKPCMVGDVDLYSDCLKWVSHHFWVPRLFIRLWRRFISY